MAAAARRTETSHLLANTYSQPQVIASKHFPALEHSMPSMGGKVVAVTGCTTGTGFVLAKLCAGKGADVLLLNRPSERAQAALKLVQGSSSGGTVTHIDCDLASFASVREAAEKINAATQSLDVLCNNAAVMAFPDEGTDDGFDVQMQTNHLSHFLLTRELMPLLEASPNARIVNHSSVSRIGFGLGFRMGGLLREKSFGKNGGNLGGDSGCLALSGPKWERYHQTKLAAMVFTYALADKLKANGSSVAALVAHPGCAATHLQVTTVKQRGMGSKVATITVCQSAEDGACGIVKCCCDPAVQSGQFYGPKGGANAFKGAAELLPAEPPSDAQKALLWTESEVAVGCKFDL